MYLVYHKKSKPTGERIGQALQIAHGFDPREDTERDILIRWGSQSVGQIDNTYETVINPSFGIRNASDKLGSLQMMADWSDEQEEESILTPDWDEDPEALVERAGYPILGRKRHHARGTDIQLCLQRRDFNKRRDYYVEYIPTVREYRIHVIGEEVIRVQGKFLDIPNQKLAWVRNYTTGYRFRAPKKRLRPVRLKMAVNAVKAVGLDFGAVDLLVADNNETYILEVNTAPSCSPLTGAEYATRLANKAGITHNLDFSHLDLLNPDQEERDSEDLDEEEMEE